MNLKLEETTEKNSKLFVLSNFEVSVSPAVGIVWETLFPLHSSRMLFCLQIVVLCQVALLPKPNYKIIYIIQQRILSCYKSSDNVTVRLSF